jgi:transcriptional regulator with XRE-family HTH domain
MQMNQELPPVRTKKISSFGIKRVVYPEMRVLKHITYTVGKSILDQFKYNNWRESIGFVNEEANKDYRGLYLNEDHLTRWMLDIQHLTLEKKVLETDNDYPTFEEYWRKMITDLADSCLDYPNPLNQLESVMNEKFDSTFRGAGVREYFKGKLRALPDISKQIRKTIELELFAKWRSGEVSIVELSKVGEKLQELRKSKSMTQEELAEALFVSRTAISKWESGRGYPSIDSLKEISRYFSVTIDDLICSDEMISVAENEKREFANKYLSLICNALDILLVILLFIPAFGNGMKSTQAVSLIALTGINPAVKIVFLVIIGLTILNGICGVIIANFNNSVWNRHRLVTGVVLSILAVTVFIVARQPYAGIICFSFLVIKGFLIAKVK